MRAVLLTVLGWFLLVSNATASSESHYLVVPGVEGSVDLPGYSGAIPIESFSFGVSGPDPHITDLHVTKPVDATSPAFHLAVAEGTHFSTADVIVYDDKSAQFELFYAMTDAIVSSDMLDTMHVPLYEHLAIDFESVQVFFAGPPPTPPSSPVPEPTAAALMLAGIMAFTARVALRRAPSERV